MSSPNSRRHSQRNSVSSTPLRSQASAVANGDNAPATSSPLFFRSSPVNGSQPQATNGNLNDMMISSPPQQPSSSMRDPDPTPRAGRQAAGESSPIRYVSSSSPTRNANNLRSDAPSSSSGLFVRSSRAWGSSGAPPVSSRRGDIHSDAFGSTPNQRRRIFVDENGIPTNDPRSEATFSTVNPDTSEAEALGGDSTRVIWGTNIAIQDSMSAFNNFLHGYARKYRMWADGASEEETNTLGATADEREYMTMLDRMLDLGITGLNLDIRNLKAYPATLKLWHQILAYPQEVVPLMDQTLKDVLMEMATQKKEQQQHRRQREAPRVRNSSSLPPAPSSDIHSDNLPSAAPTPAAEELQDLAAEVELRSYKVLPFGLDETINMRELDPADMDKLVSIKGLVIRATPVIPDMKDAFFKCSVCEHTVKVDIDRGKIAEPTVCPRNACASKESMQIVHNRSTFADKQIIKLQETPDNVPDGQTPHSVSLCVYDELVDVCKAGDRIQVTGIFRSNPVRINPRQRTIKALFKTYIDVLHVQKTDKKKLGIDVSTVEQEVSEAAAGDAENTRKISAEEKERIEATARRPDVYELLARSLAPSIYEMDDVKKGILLQLFGGTNKSFQKGGSPKYRGDINILLCGDPSTAKSQLLTYVHKIAPRGVYTSGKGSSAVGLTAYVTRDPESRQLVLESGALVLSDGGVCCIDEFDKMNESTRSVLHEVMEQQTVSIAKAGIITTLNARTSILASANPIGSKYNPNLPVPQNIDLPPTLLSRFDLVYLVLDRIDETNDRRLAKHLVGIYLEDSPENASSQEILPIDFLTAYITHARQSYHPTLSPAARTTLVESYVTLRSLGSAGPSSLDASSRRITATTRQLESMIRLSEAHAKMRLSHTVEESDVLEAVRLIKSAIKEAATDKRTGLIDMALLTEGTGSAERRKREDLKRGVLETLDGMGVGGFRWGDVFRRVTEGVAGGEEGVEGAEFSEAIRSLESEGKVAVGGGMGGGRTIRRVTGVV